jgi:hypothetical protein
MKNLQDFSINAVSTQEATNLKGGAYNIFCELYIGRQESKGEEVDPAVLNRLMKWDTGLNSYLANR